MTCEAGLLQAAARERRSSLSLRSVPACIQLSPKDRGNRPPVPAVSCGAWLTHDAVHKERSQHTDCLIRCERGTLVRKHWLAPIVLALLWAGSGWNTTASAQDADALDNKLVFAVVVNQIFNQGRLALVGDFMAKDVPATACRLAAMASRR